MRHAAPGRVARRLLVAIVALPAFLAASTASSEIFKCVAKDGSPLYQNFPCNIDSLGSLPSASLVATARPAVAGTSQDKPQPVAVQVSSAAAALTSSEPRVGMSSDEVRTLWGEPEEMIEDEPATGGRISTWRYPDNRIVRLDNKHRVLGVQR